MVERRYIIDTDLLKKGEGKCLCNPNQKCTCENFRETGKCHCGLFIEVENE